MGPFMNANDCTVNEHLVPRHLLLLLVLLLLLLLLLLLNLFSFFFLSVVQTHCRHTNLSTDGPSLLLSALPTSSPLLLMRCTDRWRERERESEGGERWAEKGRETVKMKKSKR